MRTGKCLELGFDARCFLYECSGLVCCLSTAWESLRCTLQNRLLLPGCHPSAGYTTLPHSLVLSWRWWKWKRLVVRAIAQGGGDTIRALPGLHEFGLTTLLPRECPNPWGGIRAATQSLFTSLDNSILPTARADLKIQKASVQTGALVTRQWGQTTQRETWTSSPYSWGVYLVPP